MHANRRVIRRMLLGAALALATLPVVGASPSSAAACDASTVLCVKFNATQDGTENITEVGVTAQDIMAWADMPANREYYVQSKPGGPARKLDAAPRLSIHTLIKNIDPDGAQAPVTFSELPNADRIPSVLGQGDLVDPQSSDNPFLDKLAPAIYLVRDQVKYIRPLRSEEDVNSSDWFLLGPDADLTLHTTGRLLAPRATASSTSVNTKDKPRFKASVEKPGTRLDYKWEFGDGLTSGKQNPTHRFKKKDTYFTSVTVRGYDGSYGRSNTITVKVAKPPKPPKAPSTSGTGGTGGTGGGTGGTGGGTGGFGGGGGGGGYVPPFIPDNPVTEPPTPTEEPLPLDDTPVDDGLEPVEGYVLAGAGAEQGSSIPGTQDPTPPTQAADLTTAKKISGGVVGALAVLLLLGLGAEIETRWLSTRLGHLRRHA